MTPDLIVTELWCGTLATDGSRIAGIEVEAHTDVGLTALKTWYPEDPPISRKGCKGFKTVMHTDLVDFAKHVERLLIWRPANLLEQVAQLLDAPPPTKH